MKIALTDAFPGYSSGRHNGKNQPLPTGIGLFVSMSGSEKCSKGTLFGNRYRTGGILALHDPCSTSNPDAVMNPRGSGLPHDQPKKPNRQDVASEVAKSGPADAEARGERANEESEVAVEPIAARLVESDSAPSIRVGSPFAVDPAVITSTGPTESIYDVGPVRYTAMGAVVASAMVLGFACAGAWWFPAGGTLVAALGCLLSIFGLYSTYRFSSAGLLVVHLCIFALCYGRSLG